MAVCHCCEDWTGIGLSLWTSECATTSLPLARKGEEETGFQPNELYRQICSERMWQTTGTTAEQVCGRSEVPAGIGRDLSREVCRGFSFSISRWLPSIASKSATIATTDGSPSRPGLPFCKGPRLSVAETGTSLHLSVDDILPFLQPAPLLSTATSNLVDTRQPTGSVPFTFIAPSATAQTPGRRALVCRPPRAVFGAGTGALFQLPLGNSTVRFCGEEEGPRSPASFCESSCAAKQ